MRKNQTLLVAGILLLASTAVAQAQVGGAGVYEVFSNPVIGQRPAAPAETWLATWCCS